MNITRFAYCFFTHRIPGKPFFICVFDNPIAFGRSGGPPLPLLNMNTTLPTPLMAGFPYSPPPASCLFTHRISRSWLFACIFFKLLLSLRRGPHFRAPARSESCSRCSAGLISALPLDPNRAPAAALASFPVPCHGMQCNAMLRSAVRCHAFSCSYDMQCLTNATPCYDMLRFDLQRHAMSCYVLCRCAMPCFALQSFVMQFFSTQRHAML